MDEKTGNIDSLVSELQEMAPTPRPEVIEHLQGQKHDDSAIPNVGAVGSITSGASNSVENSGATAPFNPEIHESNEDGTPRLTKNGQYRLKRGRKGGSNTVSPGNAGAAAKPPVDYKGLAQFVCSTVFGGLTQLLGPAWKPSEDEDTNITTQTARTLEYYGISDLPPALALTIAVGMYALPRLNDSETHRRARLLGSRIGICSTPKDDK